MELRREIAEKSVADLEEIKQLLTKTMRQEIEEEVLMTEGVARGVTETVRYTKKADVRCALRAADQLARMLGGYEDRIDVKASVVITDDLE